MSQPVQSIPVRWAKSRPSHYVELNIQCNEPKEVIESYMNLLNGPANVIVNVPSSLWFPEAGILKKFLTALKNAVIINPDAYNNSNLTNVINAIERDPNLDDHFYGDWLEEVCNKHSFTLFPCDCKGWVREDYFHNKLREIIRIKDKTLFIYIGDSIRDDQEVFDFLKKLNLPRYNLSLRGETININRFLAAFCDAEMVASSAHNGKTQQQMFNAMKDIKHYKNNSNAVAAYCIKHKLINRIDTTKFSPSGQYRLRKAITEALL